MSNMSKNLVFYLSISLCVIYSCNNQNRKTEIAKDNFQDHTLYSIDFPALLKKKRETRISEISETIEYLQLETSAKSIVGRILDAKFTKDYIFIEHRGTPLLTLYDWNGKFVRHIGRVGRGPGEYLLMRSFSINEANRLIYIQTNWTGLLLVYNFEGDFLNTYPLEITSGIISWNRNNLFVNYTEPIDGNENFLFTEINSSSYVIQTVKNPFTWKKTNQGSSSSYRDQTLFYRVENKLHFKSKYNDTIYTFDENDRIIPKFFIDLKKYRLPDEMRPERGIIKKIPAEYFWVSAKESKKYMFLRYSAYEPIEDKGPFDEGYMIYNKDSHSGNAIGKKGSKVEFLSDFGDYGFENDIDGGPDLIPEYTNDSLVFNFVSALELKKYITSEKFLKSTPKFPDRKEMLIQRLNGLQITDNDVLMIVKLN
jgi:hypothetical protein